MKKLILIFLAIFAIPVYAENGFTEYEYIGTQTTVPIVDEFTRYDTLTLHKFYLLKESTHDIIMDDTYKNYDSWKLLNSIKLVTKTPSSNHQNQVHYISKALENLTTTSILAKNIDVDRVKIEKIVFKSNDIEFLTELNPEGRKFTIPIEPHFVNDLEIEFYYDCTIDGSSFTLNLNSSNGDMEVTVVPLPKEYNKITVSFKTMEEYTKFLEVNNFEYKFDMTYYTHEENTYECFNYEKEYLSEPLEIDSLEGYMYDKEEDITLYKVYKRTTIEDDDDVITSDNSKSDQIQTYPVNNITNKNPNSENKNNTVDNSEVIDNTNEEIVDKIEDETLAFIDKKDNTSIEDTNCTYAYNQLEKATRLLTEIKWLLTILIILIIIRLIHTFNVNIAK